MREVSGRLKRAGVGWSDVGLHDRGLGNGPGVILPRHWQDAQAAPGEWPSRTPSQRREGARAARRSGLTQGAAAADAFAMPTAAQYGAGAPPPLAAVVYPGPGAAWPPPPGDDARLAAMPCALPGGGYYQGPVADIPMAVPVAPGAAVGPTAPYAVAIATLPAAAARADGGDPGWRPPP